MPRQPGWIVLFIFLLTASLLVACQPAASKPQTLRLGVALTPQEFASFEAAVAALDEAHPEWEIVLENTPQSGVLEKINAQLAADELPDVLRLQGLLAQRWIRQDAFLQLDDRIASANLPMDDFYPGPLSQFEWQGGLWGLPDTAAPDIVFYNKTMFDAAGLAYPDDTWTFDDMRQAAILLTLDVNGLNPSQPGFDPTQIQQFGWNGGLSFFWQRHLVQPFGGDFCAVPDCSEMVFTAPETVAAARWWSELVSQDFAAPYDPYGGSQTGVPGDPFLTAKAAMGFNGFFAVGQLNSAGGIEYDIAQPFLGVDGQRYTPLSTSGYVISASSQFPDAAWALVQALLEPEFLGAVWGQPGHGVPARRSAAESVLNPAAAPANQQVILQALEYGQVFKPDTASAFEVYGKTVDFFTRMMKGEMTVEDALAQIEAQANQILAADR